ncbi:MAG: helix-turn-helix transcriptional regulator [Bacteroidetes bacterium]|nr:helix-turn-helix transcriptional regulator [Bacteroidota bacterium]
MTALFEFTQALGFAIKATRAKNSLTQRKVKEKAKINSHRLIPEAEIGKRNIKLSTAFKICVGLDEKLSNIVSLVNLILNQPNWVEENRSLLDRGTRKTTARIRVRTDTDFSENNFSLVLGDLIREIRIVHGFSQQQLSLMVRFQSNRAVPEYELGLRCPRLTTLFKLCRGLEVNASYIVELMRNKFTIEKRPFILMNRMRSILKDMNEQKNRKGFRPCSSKA